MSYQKNDAHIIDYHIYNFEGIELRGPQIDLKKPYFSCVGAAQTFGRFCENPFPLLLGRKLGLQALNLGLAGAIPAQFINGKLLAVINKSRLAVIQVLSGRCGSNSRYTTVANQVGIKHDDNTIAPPAAFWQYAEKKYSKKFLGELVEETRRDYLYKMMTLLQSIKVKKILFYISIKKPDDLPDRMTETPFPHFLRRYLINKMVEFCDEYVEYVSSQGLPQRFYDKKGNPTTVKTVIWNEKKEFSTHNFYYPSPEMQKGAAQALEPVCRRLLKIPY